MTDQMHSSLQAYEQLLQAEFQDSLDEELEMELDDARMDGLIARAEGDVPLQPGDLSRRTYFSELLRLQGELVKLQDWVVHNQLKVVVPDMDHYQKLLLGTLTRIDGVSSVRSSFVLQQILSSTQLPLQHLRD